MSDFNCLLVASYSDMWIVLPVLVGSDEPVKLHPKPKTYQHEEADLRQRLHEWHAEGLVVTEVHLADGRRLPDRQFYVLQSEPTIAAGDEIALEVLNAFDEAKTVPLPAETEFTSEIEVEDEGEPQIKPVETLDSKVDWLVRMVGELLEKSGRDSTNLRLAAAQQQSMRPNDDDLLDLLDVKEAQSSGTSTENFIKSLMRLQSIKSPPDETPAAKESPPIRAQDIEIHESEPEESGDPRPMDVPPIDIPDPEDFDDIDIEI